MKRTILIIVVPVAGLIFYLMNNTSKDMKNINEYLKSEVENKKSPSIQYAFFDLDSSIYEFSYGLRDISSEDQVNQLTTYNIFSVTKTITALAVLQLAESGRIGLKQPVRSYLPDFKYYDENITVEQLLTHTAGLPNPLPLKWIHLAEEHDHFKRDAFFEKIFRENSKMAFAPGTKFKYSNLGYVILGRLIEKVSRATYEDYVKQHILQPLKIDPATLGFTINPGLHAKGYHKYWSVSNAALGFLIDKGKFMEPKVGGWKPFRNFYVNGTPYGGMTGSRVGLMKYGQALLKKNSVLISEEYKNILLREYVIGNKPTGMSMSWFTGDLKGNRYLAHAGGGGGYYVELRIYPDLGVGSVIMLNRTGMSDERMLDKTDSFFIRDNETLNN